MNLERAEQVAKAEVMRFLYNPALTTQTHSWKKRGPERCSGGALSHFTRNTFHLNVANLHEIYTIR